MNVRQQARRQSALQRLKTQLSQGTKTSKGSFDKVSLTDKDRKRIQKEITILETRV